MGLRAGWDGHIAFSLANPALFVLLADPARATQFPSAAAGIDVLRTRVRRVAAAGRLRVGEQHAVDMIRAAGTGTVLATHPDDRDPHLSDAMYVAVAERALADPSTIPTGSNTTTAAALAVRAAVDDLTTLSPAERAVLAEWLDRITATR